MFRKALANDPEFLLIDEPFGALDAQTRLIMQEILLKVWEDTGKTILFVTHDVNVAVFLVDKVYVMTAHPGKLKYIQDVDFERPRHPDIKYDLGIISGSSDDPAGTRSKHSVLSGFACGACSCILISYHLKK